MYFTVEEAAALEGFGLIYLFSSFPETSQAIRPHVAQQRVVSQQLSECVTAV